MSDYLIKLAQRDTSIIEQSHEETEQTGKNATTDYRYVGKDPNNYVCLKSEGTCSEDELYRIVGVIPTEGEDGAYKNRVKLIKASEYVGESALDGAITLSKKGYKWSETSSNVWENATLNTEKLNQEYWESINEYQNYIDKVKWYLNETDSGNITTIYKNERGGTKYFLKEIGLIYLSDYGYATNGGSNDSRDKCISYDINWGWHANANHLECSENNWLALKGDYWFITSAPNNKVWTHSYQNAWYVVPSYILGIRPSFYLKTEVTYLSGTGEKQNPFHFSL